MTKFDIEQQVKIHIETVGVVDAIVVGIHIWRDRTVQYDIQIPTLDIKTTVFEDWLFN